MKRWWRERLYRVDPVLAATLVFYILLAVFIYVPFWIAFRMM